MFGTDRDLCARIAHGTGAVVLDCDYRKGPEYPHPAAAEDAVDAVLYVHANPAQFDTSRVSVGGASAGGCIALLTCAYLGRERVHAATCLYPCTTITRSIGIPPPLKDNYRCGIVLPPSETKLIRECYTMPGDDLQDPLLSPLFAPATQFPDHIFTLVGDSDTLYGDSKLFYDKIKSEGSPAQQKNVEFIVVKDVAHAFNLLSRTNEDFVDTDAAYSAIVAHVSRAFEA